MAGTYPAHKVEFAPGIASSAVPAGGDWVEITGSVFEWSVKWGTEDEFTQPPAGTADLLLDNSDGDFDPDNSSGSYFGDLLPFMWFRILGGTTTANTDVFYGQVSQDGFQVGASQYADSVVRVRLVDASEFLANSDLPGSVYEIEVKADTPALWWRLGETRGTEARDSSGNGRHGTYAGGATAGSTGGLIFGETDPAVRFDGVDDEVTLTSVTPGSAFALEVWVQADTSASSPQLLELISPPAPQHGFISLYQAFGIAKLNYAYTNPATGSTTTYQSTASVFDGQVHHVVVTQSGSTTNLYVDGVEGKTLLAGSATSITWPAMSLTLANTSGSNFIAATVDEFAIYTSALSAARVLAHYNAGDAPWEGELSSARIGRLLDQVGQSSSQRNLNTGNSTLTAATLNTDAWAAVLEVARAEAGFVYIDHQDAGKVRFINRRHRWTAAASLTSQVTIGDGGGAEVPAESIDLQDDRIVNRANIQRAGGTAVLVENSASQTTYRKRSLSETGLQYQTDTESQHRGERVVAEKKDRHRRPRSVTLAPRKSTHPAWNQVFARKLNDRVTVKWRPPYGGTRTYDAWIIGIQHRWAHNDGLRTTFHLAPVPFDTTGAPYWIWGTSTWETGTNVARWSY